VHISEVVEMLTPPVVLSVLIVNSDNLPPTTWQTIYQSAGIEAVSFAPSASALTFDQWPTLGGKRLYIIYDGEIPLICT